MSRLAGSISRVYIPEFARPWIFGPYCKHYKVNMEEAEQADITQYSTLSEFFTRSLKPECRPIDCKVDLISPCDGKVLHLGPITDENQIEQVKGMTYSLQEFIGESKPG